MKSNETKRNDEKNTHKQMKLVNLDGIEMKQVNAWLVHAALPFVPVKLFNDCDHQNQFLIQNKRNPANESMKKFR